MSHLGQLIDGYGQIDDFRVDRTKKYPLVEILSIATVAVLAGAEGFEEIAEFGQAKETWFAKHLPLKNGIPSHDTFNRVFRLLSPQGFQDVFAAWSGRLLSSAAEPPSDAAEPPLRTIAVDGKSLRGSADPRQDRSMLHSVSAFATELGVTLACRSTDSKSNEITAIPELLQWLELGGSVVSIDAMGCQKAIAQKIIEGGGDYMLAVKDNQPTLAQAAAELMQAAEEGSHQAGRLCVRETLEKNRNRSEHRIYYQLTLNALWQEQFPEWPGLKSFCRVVRIVTEDETQRIERADYISSLSRGIDTVVQSIRSHWAIENRSHWVLDVVMREDDSRVRSGHAAENLSLVRRAALNLLRLEPTKKSLKRKQKLLGWSQEYFETMLNALI